jgi:adenosylhomocysteine nucleosidase
MPRIAIIAALEREVRPLIRNWTVRTIESAGRRYRVFESGVAVLVCGGIGAAAARRATEAVIDEIAPERVLSVGFVGALDDSLKVGDIIEPRTVINSGDGVRTEIDSGCGDGTLVSYASVADREQKNRLRVAYSAVAVDMEAAAVAQAAQARSVEFGAMKSISDDADFNMPAMDRFIASDGSFESLKFALHVAVRPWLWKPSIVLARNSSIASRALSNAIAGYLARECATKSPLSADLDKDKVTQECASAHTR